MRRAVSYAQAGICFSGSVSVLISASQPLLSTAWGPAAIFDYETTPAFSIRIRVTDPGGVFESEDQRPERRRGR